MLLLSVATVSFFARLTWLPATPDLILGAVLAIALLDSRRSAAVAGIGGGVLLDALGGVGASLSPLFYLLVVLFVGAFAEKTLGRFGTWLVLMLPTLILKAFFTTALALLRGGIPAFSVFFSKILLPEAWVTLLFGIPLYFIGCLCMLLLKDRRERSPR